jgi:hypothetical protein
VHAQEPRRVQRELRSQHNLGGWTGKRRKTHHVGSSKDKLTVGLSTACTGYTPGQNPRASLTEQGGTTVAVPQQGHIFYHEFEDPDRMRHSKATLTISQDCDGDEEMGPRGVRRDFHSADQRRGRDPKEQRDCITPAGSYETVGARLEIRSDLFSLNQRRLFRSAEEFDTGIRNTRRPRLFDNRSRLQDPCPLVEWSDPPGGRPGVDGKHVLQPQQSRLRSQ